MINHCIYNELVFEKYCECTEGTIHECVLSYTQIQLESLERDFENFCKRFSPYITYREEDNEGSAIYFAIPITVDYTLYIMTTNGKVSAFQIEERYLSCVKNEAPNNW